jgi:hypothetical protein
MSRPRSRPCPSPARRILRAVTLSALAALASLAVVTGRGAPPAEAQAADSSSGGPANQAPSELARLFPREAELFVDYRGLAVAWLPAEVLKEAKPDLSDVRIFSAEGAEVPFAVMTTLPRRAFGSVEHVMADPIDAKPRRRRGEEGDAKKRERFVVEVPNAPSRTGAWELSLTTAAPLFVRQATVREASEKGRVLATMPVFRLPSPMREQMRVALPAGVSGRIELSLESEEENVADLNPSIAFEAARAASDMPPAVVPLVEVERSRSEGKTIVTLARPRGLVPSAVRVQTSTGTFYRRVEVWDEEEGRSTDRLGSSAVFREETTPPLAELSVPVSRARGERLRVSIEGGDGPELAELALFAVVERPSVVFSLPSLPSGRGDAPSGTLRFGGGRTYKPSYALEGLATSSASSRSEELASLAAQLLSPREVPEAKVGAVRPNPAFDAKPAFSFAMRPAAEIDRAAYSHRMALRVTEAPEGVSRARLSPAVLAVARADLADVRVVDESNRQWPYLLEPRASEAAVDLRVSPPSRRLRRSHFALAMPIAPLVIEELSFDIAADYVDRSFRIVGQVEGGGEEAAPVLEGRFARRPGEPRAFVAKMPAMRLLSLEVSVDDGDDAPLELRGVTAKVSVPDLFVVAPVGSYTLLAGHAEASAPRYELAHARDLVVSVRAPVVEPGALEANPTYVAKPPPGLLESYALWVVLGVAVVTLGALTLRLANTDAPKEAPPPEKADEKKTEPKVDEKKVEPEADEKKTAAETDATKPEASGDGARDAS